MCDSSDKKIEATKGPVGRNSLVYANRSINGNDKTYGKYLKTIGEITDERNELASQMIALLNGAAFEHQRLREQDELIERARRLRRQGRGSGETGVGYRLCAAA